MYIIVCHVVILDCYCFPFHAVYSFMIYFFLVRLCWVAMYVIQGSAYKKHRYVIITSLPGSLQVFRQVIVCTLMNKKKYNLMKSFVLFLSLMMIVLEHAKEGGVSVSHSWMPNMKTELHFKVGSTKLLQLSKPFYILNSCHPKKLVLFVSIKVLWKWWKCILFHCNNSFYS